MFVKFYSQQSVLHLHISISTCGMGPRSDIKSYTDMTVKSILTSTYLLCSELKRHNQAEIIGESVFIFILVS